MLQLPNFRRTAALALSFLSFSLPAWAEEAEAEAGKGDLPQFDPGFFAENIFWMVVSFAVLYVLMASIALPRVAKAQANRKKVISAEIETARNANEAAKASASSVEKSLAEARDRAHASVSESLARVAEEANERRATQERELSRRLHRAEEDIAVTRTEALEQVKASAEEFAKAVEAKILGSKERARA